MIGKKFDELFQKLIEIEELLVSDEDDAQNKLLRFESDLNKYYDFTKELQNRKFKSIVDKIKQLKEEYDFYDEDTELDMMFPNRNEDDFDEDSMSYESVFGKD